jgi:hypothetical protein
LGDVPSGSEFHGQKKALYCVCTSKKIEILALLRSPRTHYRGRVMTDSLNQGMNFPKYP